MKKTNLYHSKIIDNKIKLSKSTVELLEYHTPDRNIVITLDIDKCILIYPAQRWEVIKTRLMKIPNAFSKEMRLFQRCLLGHMHKSTLDETGEIKSPNLLINIAELFEDISILEMNKKIEIWDKDNFGKEIDLMDGKKRYKLYRYINDVLDIQHKETISKIFN